MEMLMDIAGIVFACTAANHLGLIRAIQTVAKCNQLPIVSCVKCFSFWTVLCYCLVGGLSVITSLATSFFCAWSAIWLDLFMGIIDHLYIKIYEQIYPTTNTTDTDALSAADAVPDVSYGSDSDSAAAS
jgi:hypothetical protein